MADNEKTKKFLPTRRNPQQNRPTPGVQKAIQTFGVQDLREILDKKRREQGDSQGGHADKRPDPKQVKLPPPDPSYNYLKDPTRDKPRFSQRKADYEKQYDRPIARDRETNAQYHRYNDEKHFSRNRESVALQQRVQHTKDDIQQENNENTSNMEEKEVIKRYRDTPRYEAAPKKELRFSDTPIVEEQSQFSRGGHRGFRGRHMKRGGGMPREVNKNIKNPVNIKIELSVKTGLRNCTLDEETKIPDIKHIPDQILYQKSPRGGFRGVRGTFRGRGRGRGSYRGRAGSSYRGKGREPKIDAAGNEDSFNMEELQKNLPEATEEDNIQSTKNGNVQFGNSTLDGNNEECENQNETEESPEDIFERYDDYDQDNEEYNDANENYDDEFSSEYYSENHNDSAELVQNEDFGESYENSPELKRYDQEIIDPNLKATITITSSKFQEGETLRHIEVVPKDDGTEKKETSKGDVQEKNEDV